MSDQKEKNQLNIELSEEVAEGIYSNLAIITHSSAEMVIDFIRVMPGVPKAKVKKQNINDTAACKKRLLRALADNIQKYESMHGPITENEGFGGLPMNFGPTAKA